MARFIENTENVILICSLVSCLNKKERKKNIKLHKRIKKENCCVSLIHLVLYEPSNRRLVAVSPSLGIKNNREIRAMKNNAGTKKETKTTTTTKQ